MTNIKLICIPKNAQLPPNNNKRGEGCAKAPTEPGHEPFVPP